MDEGKLVDRDAFGMRLLCDNCWRNNYRKISEYKARNVHIEVLRQSVEQLELELISQKKSLCAKKKKMQKIFHNPVRRPVISLIIRWKQIVRWRHRQKCR